MATYHHHRGAVVEKPEQMSVSELKAWLSQFGEKNRKHFENNQVRNCGDIRSKISKFQDASLSTSSSGSTSVSSPPQLPIRKPVVAGATVKREKQDAKSLVQANLPVFREFDKEENRSNEAWQEKEIPMDELGNFRIVSIQKLADPPKPKPKTISSLFSFPRDATDGVLDPWTSPCLDTDAFSSGHRNHHEDAKTVWSLENDNQSVFTGRFTDPGTQVQRNVFTPDDENSQSWSLRSRLICKSRKEKEADVPRIAAKAAQGSVHEQASWAPVKESAPLFKDQSFTEVASYFLAAAPAEPVPHIPSILADEESVSTWSESSVVAFPESRDFLDTANIGDIFSEEAALDRLDGCSKGEDFEARNRQHSTTTSCTGSTPNRPPFPTARSLVSLEAQSDSRVDKDSSGRNKKSSVVVDGAAVSLTMARFGHKTKSQKKSAVQLRREQLEKKWAEDRAPVDSMSRKVKWHASNGCYKKKVILDYSDDK